MKLALLFLFAMLTPFTVFLTEVLYGGTTPDELKRGLAQTAIYTNASIFLITAKAEGKQDTAASELSEHLYKRFIPEYIQSKTEKLIDDGHIWVTADGPSPTLSFIEIKQDLISINPAFQAQFEQIQSVAQQSEFSAENSLSEYAGSTGEQSETDALTALAQNNFTVPVGEYFQGIKTFYSVIQILQPILVLLLIATLFLLIKQNLDTQNRLKWLGATLITAAVFGFGMVFFNTLAIANLMQTTTSSSGNFLAAFAPIMLQLMDIFMSEYAKVQNNLGICMVIVGIFCFAGAALKAKNHAKK